MHITPQITTPAVTADTVFQGRVLPADTTAGIAASSDARMPEKTPAETSRRCSVIIIFLMSFLLYPKACIIANSLSLSVIFLTTTIPNPAVPIISPSPPRIRNMEAEPCCPAVPGRIS